MNTNAAAVVLFGALLPLVAPGEENAATMEKTAIASPRAEMKLQPVAPKQLEPIGNPIAVVYCCDSAPAEKPAKIEVPSVREFEQFHSNAKAAISDSFGKPVRLFGSAEPSRPIPSGKPQGEGSKK